MFLTELIKNGNKRLFEVNTVLQPKDEIVVITDLINSAYKLRVKINSYVLVASVKCGTQGQDNDMNDNDMNKMRNGAVRELIYSDKAEIN